MKSSSSDTIWLTSQVGESRLLTRIGERRLHLINEMGSLLWDLHASGMTRDELCELLENHLSRPANRVSTLIERLFAEWRVAGLLDENNGSSFMPLDQEDDPAWPPPHPQPLPIDALCLTIADRVVQLKFDDPGIEFRFIELLALGSAFQSDHRLHLQGSADNWRLLLDENLIDQGEGSDGAVVAVLSTLTDLGCRPAERMLVIHGAGLVNPDGHGVVLAAPGGSGKSTLTVALNAQGYELLSDDVVPLDLDGSLLGLGLPMCLKSGAWPILHRLRPDLDRAAEIQRFDQKVRFLPSIRSTPIRTARASLLLFPQYEPDGSPHCAALTPEQALQGLIEADSVLRNLTQFKLDALANWINNLPAYGIRYSSLDEAMDLVTELTQEHLARTP